LVPGIGVQVLAPQSVLPFESVLPESEHVFVPRYTEAELRAVVEAWRGSRMALILDHVNGVADDHRLENLRIVCPNCAATFATHCGRGNRRPREERACGHCGESFVPKFRDQRYCSRRCGARWNRETRRRVERPPYEQLPAEIAATSWCAVGRKYGVSDTAVRKWVRAYEREGGASAATRGVREG
jgi:hypothetical protein